MAYRGKDHISVCICTFKRPLLLERLLKELSRQHNDDRFSFSAVVVDNDAEQSARDIVSSFGASSPYPVTYCVEADQNIALARNRALENATGNFFAFIDDDEYPSTTWLQGLYDACSAHAADGVLGPVSPYFEELPPSWILKGGFFERPRHATGYMIGPRDMRTSNVLLKRDVIDPAEPAFRPEFGSGGEDVDFFRRMTKKGCLFVWCDEAIVNELIPPARCKSVYLLRRALHRGNISYKLNEGRDKVVAKAFLAIPIYVMALPLLILAGRAPFMKYLVKLCDHTGLLLGLLRITPFDKYK